MGVESISVPPVRSCHWTPVALADASWSNMSCRQTLSSAVRSRGCDAMRPRIFIGSSWEAIDVCRAVQFELAGDFDLTV